jgi:SAM-dependent methyltransferase
MGMYCDHIFPRLMEWVMARDEFYCLRRELLTPIHGDVLELGIGTGLNLLHYPQTVRNLYAVDPALLLPETVLARRASLPFPVHLQQGTAEALSHANHRFDYIVSTWTLCTIPNPVRALQEVGRVLKPGGIFLFLEHGLSDDRTIATWQDRLNPLQNIIGCGCNLNRRIDQLITQAGLQIAQFDRFTMKSVPRLGGEMYRGMVVSHG